MLLNIRLTKKAVFWYTKAAKQGYVDAQNNLGICYVEGNGVLKDIKKATEWIKKAKNAGHLKAAETWKTLELWKY